jgi:hypothetical protein
MIDSDTPESGADLMVSKRESDGHVMSIGHQ